jgi:DNA (cytosine-5)-methyltransferase 1
VNFLSVCSGIEAASVAWHDIGFKPVAFSEIEPFPCALLSHHYPTVPNWGDMTKFKEWPDADVDVLVGGTPCQSFSVAGLRKGLADTRGNLTLTFLAIADRYRPEWILWENVPGVLSIDGGRIFGTFLRALAELGYGFAYRVLDAQYFGVAQRRRRVFVVANARDWRRAAAVLFEPESLSGNPPPSREEGQRAAPCLAARTRGGGGLGTDAELDGALVSAVAEVVGALCGDSHPGAYSGQDAYTGRLVAHSPRADGFDASEDGTGRGTPIVPVLSFDTTQVTSRANYSNPKPGDPCHPLAAGAHIPAVATTAAVRRLAPTECERLQGFPDGYTLIPYRGKPAAVDGPRYKALGNSMAVPVMRWIGQRIQMVSALEEK